MPSEKELVTMTFKLFFFIAMLLYDESKQGMNVLIEKLIGAEIARRSENVVEQ